MFDLIPTTTPRPHVSEGRPQGCGPTPETLASVAPPPRVAYLDGWRGLAVTLVLIQHFFVPLRIDLGTFGVDLFFVLSGVLMSEILFVRQTTLTHFYKRRISRILPAFFVYVLAICGASWLFSLSDEHHNLIYILTFLRAYVPVDPPLHSTGIPIGHLWSLNVEEHSYVLLSLLTLVPVVRRRPDLALLGLGCGFVLIRALYRSSPSLAPPAYELRTEALASHIFLAAGYHLARQRWAIQVPPWAPVVALALALAGFVDGAPPGSKWVLGPFLLAFSVNHLAVSPAWARNLLSTPAATWMGNRSYSIYLWQQPFYYYGMKFGPAFPGAGWVLLPCAVLTGWLSYTFVEGPLRNYLNRRW